MNNQHKKIKGYRDLSQEEIELMNDVKNIGNAIGKLIDILESMPTIDKRWLSIGKTDTQIGIMAIVRSIAQPTSF